MRLAVVQMLPTGEFEEDLHRLLELLASACAGADLVVLPAVPSLLAEPASFRSALDADRRCSGTAVLSPYAAIPAAGPFEPEETPLGRTLSLSGDDCIDPAAHPRIRAAVADALVLRAEPESALQAEAILELAVGYSTSLAGLVIVCSAAAPDPAGEPHGGTSIVQHSEVLAEAVDPDDVIRAEVYPPVRLQEPVSPPPEPQLILRQRLAHHQGRKADVGWLADLD